MPHLPGAHRLQESRGNHRGLESFTLRPQIWQLLHQALLECRGRRPPLMPCLSSDRIPRVRTPRPPRPAKNERLESRQDCGIGRPTHRRDEALEMRLLPDSQGWTTTSRESTGENKTKWDEMEVANRMGPDPILYQETANS